MEQFLVKQETRERTPKEQPQKQAPPQKSSPKEEPKVKPEQKRTLFGKKKDLTSSLKNFTPEGAIIKQGWLTKKGKKSG